MKVTLVDYGAGNVPSVKRALERLGAEVELAETAEAIRAAKALVLPGVGHCTALTRALDSKGLREPLTSAIAAGVPFLGICLGLQALYEKSEEAPEETGLGVLAGSVKRLPEAVKLPHMGWNQVRATKECSLLAGIPSEAYFYFAHSYAVPAGGADEAAICEHGARFVAVAERGNLFAVQFHPEKSGEAGAKLLGNFLRRAA